MNFKDDSKWFTVNVDERAQPFLVRLVEPRHACFGPARLGGGIPAIRALPKDEPFFVEFLTTTGELIIRHVPSHVMACETMELDERLLSAYELVVVREIIKSNQNENS